MRTLIDLLGLGFSLSAYIRARILTNRDAPRRYPLLPGGHLCHFGSAETIAPDQVNANRSALWHTVANSLSRPKGVRSGRSCHGAWTSIEACSELLSLFDPSPT